VRSFDPHHWALILGGSRGFGLATAQKLSRHGMNVAVVHRDRRGAMPRIQPAFDAIAGRGVGFRAFNVDALSPDGRATVLHGLEEAMRGGGRVRLLLHCISWGNLGLIAPARGSAEAPLGDHAEPLRILDDESMARTVYAMGTSLMTWAQAVAARELFAEDARVLAMTSEGNRAVWRGYAAVSAAKGALEAIVRALAVELAPWGVRANVVQAGVTDTPALRLIPGHEQLLAASRRRNPFGRSTRPEDVADFIALLCTDEAAWVNGGLLLVDGGEHLG